MLNSAHMPSASRKQKRAVDAFQRCLKSSPGWVARGFLGAKKPQIVVEIGKTHLLEARESPNGSLESMWSREEMLTKAYSGEVSEMYVALPTQCV